MQTDKVLRQATMLALTTAAISGVSNFLNKYASAVSGDAVVITTVKNAIVAVLLVGLLVAIGKRREIAALSRRQLGMLFAIGAVGGSLPFAMFFTGLAQTSAVNASLIHKSLFLWVIALAAPLLKEKMSVLQWLGVAAIFGSNLIVGGFKGFAFSYGEMLILGATMLWAVENVIAKKALRDISSTLVAASRMAVGAAILLPFALARGGAAMVAGYGAGQWGWTMLTAVLLFAYVVTWYAALKLAPASYVATLLVPATLVTNALSAVIVTHSLAVPQIESALLAVIGSALMITFAKKTDASGTVAPAAA